MAKQTKLEAAKAEAVPILRRMVRTSWAPRPAVLLRLDELAESLDEPEATAFVAWVSAAVDEGNRLNADHWERAQHDGELPAEDGENFSHFTDPFSGFSAGGRS